DAGRHRLLEENQSARHVDVDEVPSRMGGHVRLVQGRRVEHRAHAPYALPDELSIADGANAIGEGRRLEVEAPRVPMLRVQGPHERLAEVTGASRHEDHVDGRAATPKTSPDSPTSGAPA